MLDLRGKDWLDDLTAQSNKIYKGDYQGEVVHHKNSKKGDNRIENLKLFSSENEHQKYHCKLNTKWGKVVVCDWCKRSFRKRLHAVKKHNFCDRCCYLKAHSNGII